MKKKSDTPVTDKIKEFLGCPVPDILGEIFNVPEELLYVTEIALGKLIAGHYETQPYDHGLDDKFIEVVRYPFLNPEDQEFPNTPTGGTLFLTDKSESCDKLVVRLQLQQLSRYTAPLFQLYIQRSRKDVATRFTRRLHETIKSFKGLHLAGDGKPMGNLRDFKWSDLILAEEVKTVIRRNVIDFIKKKELFQRRNIQMRRGIMLHGNPGTGKTLLSIVLANETDANLVAASTQHMITPACVAKVFNLARFLSAPTIVSMEDLDLIGGKDRESTSRRDLLGELLNQLDSFESNEGLIVIASTNDASVFDRALGNRPGRFDIKLELPLPEQEQRIGLFKRFTEGIKVSEDVNVAEMIKQMQGLSCAHIHEIVNYAKILNTERTSEKEEIVLSREDLSAAMAVWNDHKKAVGFN